METKTTDVAMEKAIRTAAVQAATLLEENAEEGSIRGTSGMLALSREFAEWISNREDKASALEALNASVVSNARSDTASRASALFAHADLFYNYITTGAY